MFKEWLSSEGHCVILSQASGSFHTKLALIVGLSDLSRPSRMTEPLLSTVLVDFGKQAWGP